MHSRIHDPRPAKSTFDVMSAVVQVQFSKFAVTCYVLPHQRKWEKLQSRGLPLLLNRTVAMEIAVCTIPEAAMCLIAENI